VSKTGSLSGNKPVVTFAYPSPVLLVVIQEVDRFSKCGYPALLQIGSNAVDSTGAVAVCVLRLSVKLAIFK
jgi:hypothetical protein